MAQYAYTFTSGDVVTPTKLNNARTVSDIVNADIKSDAAIAGTKIVPDFGSQNVVTTGSFSAQGITSEAPSSAAAITVRRASNNDAPPYQFFHKSRGTLVAKTAVQNNDDCGGIFFRGYDGATDVSAASIIATVDGTPGTNDMPARLVFSTTADGGSSPTERMRITSGGNVGIATTAPTERLHVTGNIKASGFIDADTSFRGQASDSAAAPSFTWTGDTNTGMFRPASDTLAFCEGGVEAMRITSAGFVLIGKTTADNTTEGVEIDPAGALVSTRLTGAAAAFNRQNDNGGVVAFRRANQQVGTISVTTTATAYNTSSDYRLKENPTPLIGGLATINQLQPCEFTWKSDGSIGRGFIAHELQAVVPEAVTGEKDAVDADGNPQYQGVDAAKLVPYLVSAVQELKARVEALEAA